jgi:hypothetical protein
MIKLHNDALDGIAPASEHTVPAFPLNLCDPPPRSVAAEATQESSLNICLAVFEGELLELEQSDGMLKVIRPESTWARCA